MTSPSPATATDSTVFLNANGSTVHHVVKDGGFLTFWYCTDPRGIDAEGDGFAYQFDVRALPAVFLDGLAVADLRAGPDIVRTRHATAIRRALSAGFDLTAAKEIPATPAAAAAPRTDGS